MTGIDLVKIVEGALMAAGKPLTVVHIAELFEEHERPETSAIREALKEVELRCEDRGFELQEVAGGFRFQVSQSLSPWVARLWHERPQKYSRAMLETLSLIAYRQPITRGEIEEIRGVAVSSNIVKTLHEREWIRIVGHRDVPGRPAMYATTRQFLDYFNLKTLDQLPALAEIRDFDTLTAELGFTDLEESPVEQEALGGDGDTAKLEKTESDNNDEAVTQMTAELDLEPVTYSESTTDAALAVVGGTEYTTEDDDADARQQHSPEPGQ
ncbi:MAG: segregation and condensation protein B [Halioglobus sp.]|jgi:segregation and condensation protein B